MFYSHDILTSHQYGVATIWQAATVNTKACMSRKAISEVDIDRAVKKILNPGVPLALRLQSNLLFGVSRVYYQKCHYVLDDATKVTHKLRVAYSDNAKDHQVNPNVVKASRHQIVLEDDPAFIWNTITAPDFTWKEPLLKTSLDLSQHDSTRTSSHMSPASSTPAPERRGGSRSGSRQGSIFLDVGQSPDRSSIAYPLNLNDSPTNKPSTIRILGDEELMPLDDLVLDLDFGEIDHQRNSHLPNEFDMLEHIPLPGEEGYAAAATAVAKKPAVDEEGDVVMLEDEAPITLEENPLPAAEAFDRPTKPDTIIETTEIDVNVAAAPVAPSQKCTRGVRRIDFVDEDISIPSATIRNQFQGYISAHDALIAKKRSRDCVRTSKQIAAGFVFEHGIGAVGAAHGTMQHPLATSFSGVPFLTRLVDPSIPPEMPRGFVPGAVRSNEEILMEMDIEDARRMPNTATQDIDTLSAQGEQSRRNTPAAEDPLGSSFAPWTRQGSAVPGSAKSARSAQSKLLSPMPGSLLQDIEHLSSDIGRSGGLRGEYSEDEFALAGIADEMSGLLHGAAAGTELGHRAMFETVGAFSEMMQEVVRRRQESRARGSAKKMRRGRAEMVWIDFNDFASAAVVSRAEAARAFLNVLTMATKNMCKIQSEYLPADNEYDLGTHVIEVGFDPATLGQRQIQDIPEE